MDGNKIVRDTGIVVGVFAIMGIGLGVTGYISIGVVQDVFSGGQGEFAQSIFQLFIALVFLQSIFTSFFLGPIVAGFTGAYVGNKMEDVREAMVVGGAGSFIGFYPMIILAVLIMSMAFEGGGAGGGTGGGSGGGPIDIWSYFGRIVILAIPTGLAGVLSSGLIFWNESSD